MKKRFSKIKGSTVGGELWEWGGWEVGRLGRLGGEGGSAGRE